MKNNNEAHEFAVFFELHRSFEQGATILLDDAMLLSRVTTILRLREQEKFVLFTTDTVYQLIIKELKKRAMVCLVLEKQLIHVQQPAIDLILPLLEKSSYEQAINAATLCGVQKIYPAVTQKTKRAFVTEAELQRLKRVMIAAAEQSKQYCLPVMAPVQNLSEILEQCACSSKLILADPLGKASLEIMLELTKLSSQHYTFIVGPEGDFTGEEKQFIEKYSPARCALTPAILRAEDAVLVGLGMLRSCLR